MRILAIGAHADDVELGCGGSLLRWGQEGHEILVYVATDSAYADTEGKQIRSAADARTEAETAAARMGARLETGSLEVFKVASATRLNDEIVSLFEREKPDICLVHWHGDTHPDHRALFLAAQHASRRCPRLLGYASNWYRGSDTFEPRFFVDISDHLDGKTELVALHASEDKRTGGAWREHLRHEAAVHGRTCGVRAAEAFHVYRYLA